MNKLITFLVTALFLGGCSTTYQPTTDIDQKYDFSSVSTFSILGDVDHQNILLSDIDRRRINVAIDEQMMLSGITKTDAVNADILISYFVVTKDKLKVTSTGTAPNYAYSARLGHPIGYSYGVSNVQARNYTEGTFVIDIIDRKSNETMWRSSLTKPMKNYKTSEERDQGIAELVSTMFTASPESLYSYK